MDVFLHLLRRKQCQDICYVCKYLFIELKGRKEVFKDVWENLLASFIKVSKHFLYSILSFHMLMNCLILNVKLVLPYSFLNFPRSFYELLDSFVVLNVARIYLYNT